MLGPDTHPPLLAGGLREDSHHSVLNLTEVPYTFGDVGEDVGARAVRPKAPDLAGLSHIPLVLLGQVTASVWLSSLLTPIIYISCPF